MWKYLFIILVLVSLGITSGCSVNLATMNVEDERLRSLPHRDFNEMPLEITKSKEDPNKTTIRHINNSKIELPNPCRLEYQSFYFDLVGLVAVTGTLPPNDKKYTVFLDTGHPGYALTNSLTILENKLAICPFGESTVHSSYMGFCELPSLQLGQAVISEPPCVYLQQQWEVRLLGLPVWQQRGVLLGLGLLKDFSYIAFDNRRKKVELSLTKVFELNKPDQWNNYSFEIKNGRLMVKMSIDGQICRLMFDSCGRYGMVVKQDFFERLPLKAISGKIRDSKFQSGFLGELPCQKTKIKDLNIGNMKVKNAEILILPENSPYTEVANSISMKFFRDTIIVLDFKNGLIWVKNNGNNSNNRR